LRQSGCPFVIVLGHPEYYPRFGFAAASKYHLLCQWDGVPDEAFMAVVADARALPKAGGVARYRLEFDDAWRRLTHHSPGPAKKTAARLMPGVRLKNKLTPGSNLVP
jgi:hypothetical protein